MDEKRRHRFTQQGMTFFYRAGDVVENRLGSRIEGSALEAPILDPGISPEPKKWYRVPLSSGMSGDGSEYHIYFKKGLTDHLVIFLSGGGLAWNEYTAARPVTGGRVASWSPNYYWSNLRPFTQIMNINVGITRTDTPRNPFDDWNFVIITYSTGDFHIGSNDFPYQDEDGTSRILHFHGFANFTESMKISRQYFPHPDQLLIAGDSAGAFAVPALTGTIMEQYYPDCRNVTLLSDSALLLYDGWKRTVSQIWKADPALCDAIHTENITADWYEMLVHRIGTERCRFLYASSTHDYLLSAFYNDIISETYDTDAAMQQAFYLQLRKMVQRLGAIAPFHYFINEFRHLSLSRGGTVHTCVRQPSFYMKNGEKSMADWLSDAVCGNPYNVGMSLLDLL